MDFAKVILGPIVTEKAERLKGEHIYTLRVHPKATKVEVKGALRKYFDCDVIHVRVCWVGSKVRKAGRTGAIQKRDPFKKVMVTLSPKSKALDLAAFKVS